MPLDPVGVGVPRRDGRRTCRMKGCGAVSCKDWTRIPFGSGLRYKLGARVRV